MMDEEAISISGSSNVLTTQFFSKDVLGQDTTPFSGKPRPEHTSLLVTPLHRGVGGKMGAPSPSILDRFFAARQLSSPAAVIGRFHGSPGRTPPPEVLPRESPAYNRKSLSSQRCTEDIRARIRNLSRTPPGHSACTPPGKKGSTTNGDFAISAIKSSPNLPGITGSVESLAARSRANQLQAEVRFFFTGVAAIPIISSEVETR